MARVAEWTDLESGAGELPAVVWGECDDAMADSVGIRVDFDDGSSASAVYGGIADDWNTSVGTAFPGLIVGPATGFLAGCPDLHFLFNNGVTLPMAWDDCVGGFSDNFDLDYNEQNGSNFRADTTGWVSAHFQTYCGEGALGAPPEIPTLSSVGLISAALLLALLGLVGLRTRRRST